MSSSLSNARRAIVIFDTRYGNTERIARSLQAGLKQDDIEATCANLKDVAIDSLGQYDLICLDGPTHYRSASQEMQDFLENLKIAKISGKQGFAFDTRRDSRFAGSAARYIEGRLKRLGLNIISPRLSGIIVSSEPEENKTKHDFESKDEWKEWKHKNATLHEGEEERFQKAGIQIGRALEIKIA